MTEEVSWGISVDSEEKVDKGFFSGNDFNSFVVSWAVAMRINNQLNFPVPYEPETSIDGSLNVTQDINNHDHKIIRCSNPASIS